MRVALTGATGFIGRYIANHLAAEGHALRCWHRASSNRDETDCCWMPQGRVGHSNATAAHIYTEPQLCDSVLRLNDRVLFSTGPFPPASTIFPKEKDLERFVEACLWSGVFKNLELYKSPGRKSGRQYCLPNGQKVDLLCQDITTGTGALVAIELKCKHQKGNRGANSWLHRRVFRRSLRADIPVR